MRQWILLLLLSAAVVLGIVVPLIDSHGAQLAASAITMSQTGDFASIVGQSDVSHIGQPHLQFWLAAIGFSWFSISGVIYKLASLIFVIMALVSTYKLGEYLAPRKTVGSTAVFILCSMAAFMLSTSIYAGVDAILCGAVTMAIWQGAVAIGGGGIGGGDNYGSRRKLDRFRFMPHLGLAVGMALSFSSVGILGVIIVAIALGIYMIASRRIKWLFSWRAALVLGMSAVLIIPELWACFDQWGWEGVRMILHQSLFSQTGSATTANQLSSLGATLPWGLLLIFFAIRSLIHRQINALYSITVIFAVTIVVLLSLLSLPIGSYLTALLPLVSIFIADQLRQIQPRTPLIRGVAITQKIVVAAIILAALTINFYCVPFTRLWMSILYGAALAGLIYTLFRPWQQIKQVLTITIASSAILWIGLNGNLYPQLLALQAGTQMSNVCKSRNIDVPHVAYLTNRNLPSFDISHGGRHPMVTTWQLKDSLLPMPSRYLLIDKKSFINLTSDSTVARRNLRIVNRVANYDISKITLSLLNPATRTSHDTIYLVDSKH